MSRMINPHLSLNSLTELLRDAGSDLSNLYDFLQELINTSRSLRLNFQVYSQGRGI